MSGIVRSRCVHGSLVRTDAATRIGFVVYWRALSMLQTTAAAAPSPVGQHMYSVFGQATTRAFITSSRPTAVWYCEYGLCMECLWFLTETFANCSIVVPYLRMCSTPAMPNTAGMRPEPRTPSVEYAGAPA